MEWQIVHKYEFILIGSIHLDFHSSKWFFQLKNETEKLVWFGIQAKDLMNTFSV